MQVDWGECGRVVVGSTTRKVSVFVAVLCYSRLVYIEFTLSQRKAEFYRGLVNALTFFGGSPRNLIFDNLKAAVLNGSGRNACFHPEFLALCGYFCCSPWPAPRKCVDPSRFLPDAPPPPRFTYLPFGAGPRVCVGAQFALAEATLALAALTRAFHITREDTTPVLPVAIVTTQPNHAPLFRLRPRPGRSR